MRFPFRKKAMAIVLAVLLLTSVLPVSAGAAAACAGNAHTPDKTTLYPADWNSTDGGYSDDYYLCSDCGAACDANGFNMVFVGAGNGCSGGRKCHLPGSSFTICDGTVCYYCTACGHIVDAAGTVIDGSSGGGHSPNISEPNNANYKVCTGGYQTTFYYCQTCGFACDANGNGLTYIRGTGAHNPDKTTLYPADWNTATGGYPDDYYLCTYCGAACDVHGAPMMFVGAGNGCSGGRKCHLPGTTEYSANYTACNGGYKVNYYLCTGCNRAVDAQGTVVEFSEATAAHSPDTDNPHPADYTACGGGFTSTWYECEVCGASCDENGDGYSSLWIAPTAAHSPDLNNEQPANYVACGGGYKTNYYYCTVCSQPCNADGTDAVYTGPTTTTHNLGEKQPANYAPCFGGYKTDYYECADCHQCFDENGNHAEWGEPTGKHTPRADKWEANWTPCGGGYKDAYYLCEYCNRACDINGNDMVWQNGNGNHTPDEGHKADWTPCGGGCKADYYICIYCGMSCDADGSYTEAWEAPTMDAKHTSSGELHKANYTDCGGGYDKDYYICDVCGNAFDTDGYTVLNFDPLTRHTPDTDNPHPADYTACGGGFKSTWYECKVCNQPCDANGDNAGWSDPTEGHDLKKVDAAEPTDESNGTTEYWVCKDCDNFFSDAKGENPIEDKDSVIIPKLEYVTAVTELSEVPESVKDKYPTVDDVSKALVEAAFAADTTLVKEDADSVVLDVVLELKSADGTVTAVTPDNFPEEGVDVVLAYPEGTDDSYHFVITHMITYGDLTGTIENMNYTLEEDGIHVHFSSMSPVCITYQKTAVEPGTLIGDANGDGIIDSNDAVLVLRCYADSTTEGIDLTASDVNGDGVVDANDAVAILRLYAGNQE